MVPRDIRIKKHVMNRLMIIVLEQVNVSKIITVFLKQHVFEWKYFKTGTMSCKNWDIVPDWVFYSTHCKGIYTVLNFTPGRFIGEKSVSYTASTGERTAQVPASESIWHTISDIRSENIKKVNKMDGLYLKGNWNVIKGKLKQKYSQLTDSDLTYVEGKEDETIGRLQQKLGKTRAEFVSEIEDLKKEIEEEKIKKENN